MDRRRFLAAGAVGALGWLARPAHPAAQIPPEPPLAPTDGSIPYGITRLGLNETDDDPDGLLYVPKQYKDGVPMPLLVYLHGLSGDANSSRFMYPLADEFGVIILSPESRRITWGRDAPGFDRDSVYIVEAMKYVNRTLYMDPAHVAIGGVSDGATYALAMGLVYGDPSFTHLMIFSEGIPAIQRKQGHPKLFIAHGTQDSQMPIDITSRRLVPELKTEGYDVTYREYDGGHGAPRNLVREAFEWFLGKPSTPAAAQK
jgi:phospholipase/carboxylesterase